MSYKREIPRLNRNNFSTWQGLMRLHLASIGDSGCKYIDQEGSSKAEQRSRINNSVVGLFIVTLLQLYQ